MIDNTEEVVLYDLEATDDATTLIAMTAEPTQRWYARKRLKAMAQQGLVAATWNPLLHPRGRDGKFIEVGGWIRWFEAWSGLWRTGQVAEINPDNGTVSIANKDGAIITYFKSNEVGQLSAAPKPKATLGLPDPKTGSTPEYWEQVGGQGGSNPGALYEYVGDEPFEFGGHVYAKKGQRWYIKHAKSVDHAANELTANQLYEMAGVPVAETRRSMNNPEVLGSQLVQLAETQDKVDLVNKMDDEEALHRLREDFVVDAWLANWDVVGLGLENVQVIDGVPYRIDAGGALLYRAQGGPKGEMFGPAVGELKTLLDPKINGQSSQAFKGITEDELLAGAEKVASVKPSDIEDLIAENGLPSSAASTLIARRAWIIAHFDIEDPWYVPPPVFNVDPEDAPQGYSNADIATLLNIGVEKGLIKGWSGGYGADWTAVTFDGSQMGFSGTNEDIFSMVSDYLHDLALPSEPEPGYAHDHLDIDHLLTEAEGSGLIADWTVTKGQGVYIVTTSSNVKVSFSSADVGYADPDQPEYADKMYDYISDWLSKQPKPPATDEVTVGPSDVEFEQQGKKMLQQALNEDKIAGWKYNNYGTGTAYFAVESKGGGLSTIYALSALQDWIDKQAGPESDASEIWISGVGWDTYTLPISTADDARENLIDLLEEFDQTYVSSLPLYGYAFVNGNLMAREQKASGSDFWMSYIAGRHPGGQTLVGPDLAVLAVPPESKSLVQQAVNLHLYLSITEDAKRSLKELNASAVGWPYALVPPGSGLMPHVYRFQTKQYGTTMPGDMVYNEETGLIGQISDDGTYMLLLNSSAMNTHQPVPSDSEVSYSPSDPGWKIVSGEDFYSQQVLRAWVERNGLQPEVVDVKPAEQDIKDLDAKDKYIDAPDVLEDGEPSVGTSDDITAAPPTAVDGISGKVPIGAALKMEGTPSDFQSMLTPLIGGVILIRGNGYDNSDEFDDDAIHPKYTYGSPKLNLFYVEDVDESGVTFRTIDGKKTYVSWYNFDTVFSGADGWVVNGWDADKFKSLNKPVFKQNGDITYNGKIVGSWQKSLHLGWYNRWEFTIFGSESIAGKPIVSPKFQSSAAAKLHAWAAIAPEDVPVKAKKSSAAVKKIAKYVETPAVEQVVGANYHDGTPAKLGDWVQSTKGGGGFVGKIVGWPDQATHPGLVFAVDTKGVQKIVKVKTQKKVPGPSSAPTELPNIYADLKYGDGSVPQVGQKVKAGKPGSQVEGIVTNLNPKQGYVYILLPDGKTTSKTFGVTSVIEEPSLIWDLDAASASAALATKAVSKVTADKPLKKKTKASEPTYVSDETGLLVEQTQAARDAWLAGHPKRKLTKDGYAPFKGMIVRNKKGEQLVVAELAGSWDANPNRLRTYNPATDKFVSTSTAAVEVDHVAMTTSGLTGGPLPKVSEMQVPTFEGTVDLPDGTMIYALKTQLAGMYNGKYRTMQTEKYIAVIPDNAASDAGVWLWNTDYAGKPNLQYTSLAQLLKWYGGYEGSGVVPVAVIDSSASEHLVHMPATKITNNMVSAKTSIVPNTSTAAPPVALVTNPSVDGKKPEVETPPAPDPEPDSADVSVEPTTGEELPTTPAVPADKPPKPVPAASLTSLVPPPKPPELIDQTSVPIYPQPPAITQTDTTVDLSGKPSVLPGVLSMQQGAERMLEWKDSKEPGTGTTYSLGDSGKVEDMLFRWQVDKSAGQEALSVRFRLTEAAAEDAVAKMVVVPLGNETGAWKFHGDKFAYDLAEGDAIAVRFGQWKGGNDPDNPGLKVLKPSTSETTPNARVVGKPIYIGKTEGTEGEKDTYRFTVVMEDGTVGELDIQNREGAPIKTFEWDHLAPAPVYGSKLSLSPVASDLGWQKLGPMGMSYAHGQDLTDETGKFDRDAAHSWIDLGGAPSGHGQRLRRVLPGGVVIEFQSAHESESGTGFHAVRHSNLSGEVRISVPITDNRPVEEIMAEVSKAMEAVGLEPEAQTAPTNEQIATMALNKFVATHHPKYTYRAKPVTGPDDPRVAETLARLNKELGGFLEGGPVTLEDLRLHTHPSGRLQVLLSPRVGKAISKRQGTRFYEHQLYGGASGLSVLGGSQNPGLLSTDERWSRGVFTWGQSPDRDMQNGAGGHVFLRSNGTRTPDNGSIIFNPAVINASSELYTYGKSDSWGERHTTNIALTTNGYIEFNYKRMIETDFIGLAVTNDFQTIIEKLKAMGITHIGGRPIEEVIVSAAKANEITKSKAWLDTGADLFADDVPVTDLIPVTAPVAAAGQ